MLRHALYFQRFLNLLWHFLFLFFYMRIGDGVCCRENNNGRKNVRKDWDRHCWPRQLYSETRREVKAVNNWNDSRNGNTALFTEPTQSHSAGVLWEIKAGSQAQGNVSPNTARQTEARWCCLRRTSSSAGILASFSRFIRGCRRRGPVLFHTKQSFNAICLHRCGRFGRLCLLPGAALNGSSILITNRKTHTFIHTFTRTAGAMWAVSGETFLAVPHPAIFVISPCVWLTKRESHSFSLDGPNKMKLPIRY